MATDPQFSDADQQIINDILNAARQRNPTRTGKWDPSPIEWKAVLLAIEFLRAGKPVDPREWQQTPSGGFYQGHVMQPYQTQRVLGDDQWGVVKRLQDASPVQLGYWIGIEKCDAWRHYNFLPRLVRWANCQATLLNNFIEVIT